MTHARLLDRGSALQEPSYAVSTENRHFAQQMANHESARMTRLYDRRGDQIKLDEAERIAI